MPDGDYARKLDELERLLNDPDVPMEPSLIWSILDEISRDGSDSPEGPAASIEARMI